MKLLDFPKLRQTYEYDCGANALQAVLAYYGIELSEEILMKDAKTNPKKGTTIKGILKTLDEFKLKYESKRMTIKDIQNYLDKKIPVLILLSAYNEFHWVVAIGYDKNKIFFDDPSSFERTFLEDKELEKKWHAKEGKKEIYNHGIAVFGKKPVYDSKKIIHMG